MFSTICLICNPCLSVSNPGVCQLNINWTQCTQLSIWIKNVSRRCRSKFYWASLRLGYLFHCCRKHGNTTLTEALLDSSGGKHIGAWIIDKTLIFKNIYFNIPRYSWDANWPPWSLRVTVSHFNWMQFTRNTRILCLLCTFEWYENRRIPFRIREKHAPNTVWVVKDMYEFEKLISQRFPSLQRNNIGSYF